MFNNFKILTAIIIFIFLQFTALAQLDSSVSEQTNKYTFGTNYASKLHFYGRTDSLKSSALVPSVTAKFSNGLYVSGSFIFVNNADASSKYTAAITEAGYRFGKNEGLAGSIYADKFFYADNSSLVQSVQKGQAGFSLSHLNNILDINTGGSAVFSDKTDFFINGGIDHLFRIETGSSIFLIIPTATINAGTQNFTSTYLKKRNVLFFPVADESVTTNDQKFQILSYEVSMPITYVYNKFAFSFTPGYVIPQNVIKVANRPDLNNAKNLFYANVGFSYTLSR